MNHEIVGPEHRTIGKEEAAYRAMPDQLRIPKDVAISKHIAQFLSVGMIKVEEERNRDRLMHDWSTAINRARSPKRLEELKHAIRDWYLVRGEGSIGVLLTDQADTRLARMTMRKKRVTHG